nr:hypothetical protein [Tanacetum cinerariifolium]
MDIEEISERFVALCFVNGLEAYVGEINLGVEENMISNEFTVKLCLDLEVKRRNNVDKKELTVALSGEIYFMKFIVNLKEDDVKQVVFGRLFLHLTKAITYFMTGTVIIYLEPDSFLIGKSSGNKRKQLENYKMTYSDIGPSMSLGEPLTQEEAKIEALGISIYERFSLLEEERHVTETMAYSDKY